MTRLRPLFKLRAGLDPVWGMGKGFQVWKRTEGRIGGQLVEAWTVIGHFEDWGEAMQELTGQHPYSMEVAR